MSIPSFALNPLPETVSAVVGGPTVRERAMPGSTVNDCVLVADPEGPAIVIAPLWASVGTTALTEVSDATEKAAATPWNETAVAPVKPEPVSLTLVPSDPDLGEIDVIDGAAHAAAGRSTHTPTTTTASASARPFL